MLKDELIKIGLAEDESEVYLTMLDLGFASVNEVSNARGLEREKVTDALLRLVEKGLVSRVDFNTVSHFEACPPSRLLDILKEREAAISSLLPGLELRFKKRRKGFEVRVFRGVNGIRNLFEDLIASLDQGGEYFLIGSINLPDKLGAFVERFHERRVRKGITAHDLFIDAERAQVVAGMELTDVKLLPQGFAPRAQICIYGDKVHQIVFSEEEDEFIGVQISNRDIAESFRTYFDFLVQMSDDLHM